MASQTPQQIFKPERTEQPSSEPPIEESGQQLQEPVPPSRDKTLEMIVPIDRSAWAIAAGYVALFTIPFVIVGPIALGLGLASLSNLKKNPDQAGRGRTWFAIIYGGFGTVLLLGWIVLLIVASK